MATVENTQKWKSKLRNHHRRMRKHRVSKPDTINDWLNFLCIDVLVNEFELHSLSKGEQERHRREDVMLSEVLGVHIKVNSKV